MFLARPSIDQCRLKSPPVVADCQAHRARDPAKRDRYAIGLSVFINIREAFLRDAIKHGFRFFLHSFDNRIGIDGGKPLAVPKPLAMLILWLALAIPMTIGVLLIRRFLARH